MLGRLLPPQPAMNLDSLSLALSQISYLVDNLTKKNYRASQQEIQHVSRGIAVRHFCRPQLLLMWAHTSVLHHQIVNRHGPEADRHLLRCLFSHVDFSGDGKSSGKDFHQVFGCLYLCIIFSRVFKHLPCEKVKFR